MDDKLTPNEGFSEFIGAYMELLVEFACIDPNNLDLDAAIEATEDVLGFFKQQRDKEE